jgi:hypothetical protein
MATVGSYERMGGKYIRDSEPSLFAGSGPIMGMAVPRV